MKFLQFSTPLPRRERDSPATSCCGCPTRWLRCSNNGSNAICRITRARCSTEFELCAVASSTTRVSAHECAGKASWPTRFRVCSKSPAGKRGWVAKALNYPWQLFGGREKDNWNWVFPIAQPRTRYKLNRHGRRAADYYCRAALFGAQRAQSARDGGV